MLPKVPLSFISGFLFKMKCVRQALAMLPLSSFNFHSVVYCTKEYVAKEYAVIFS